MSYIETIFPGDATGSLKKTYQVVLNSRGTVANIMQISSLHPQALAGHVDLYRALMYDPKSPLTRVDRELIATVVSQVNDCHY